MRTSLVALVTGALIMVPVVASCGNCSGVVQHRTLSKSGGYVLRIHNNTGTGNQATFCEVSGFRQVLEDCDAGALYPRCSK